MRRTLRPSRSLAVVALCLAAALPAVAQTPEAPVPRPVKTMVVEAAEASVSREFFGQVVARQTVDLAFQVAGQIVEFPVLEGTQLPEGQLIARLDLEPFGLSLRQAELQKAQSDRALERLQQLTSSAVSQVSIDDAQTAADLAAIQVRNARLALERATLNAPFAALVAAREVANYTTVQAGTPVVRLHDVSEWRVEIEVPEVLFRRAGEDPDIDLVGRFAGTDRSIPLELREFNAEASQVGQTFRITLAMLEPPGPGVLPGTSITVVATLAEASPGLVVPQTAIAVSPSGETAVMVFDPGEGEAGTIRRQPVELAATASGAFSVVSGLEAGTEIVAAGAGGLEDGQAVRRFAGFSN